MTSVTGSMRAAAIGAAILTAAPPSAVALGWPGQIFSSGQENLLHKAVYAYELYYYGYVPYYYDDENYCWQQVWTANNGWRWVDVCHGYAY